MALKRSLSALRLIQRTFAAGKQLRADEGDDDEADDGDEAGLFLPKRVYQHPVLI